MPDTALKSAGLLGIESLDRGEIEAILERARFFQPIQNESYRRLDVLRGKMIVNLFFEASTRTRVSFEIAARRLGADTVSNLLWGYMGDKTGFRAVLVASIAGWVGATIMLLNLHLKLRAQMELITLLARKIAIADTTRALNIDSRS